ncbi:MAG: hypothetical protein Q9160_003090 [Pyrenula sp. 1 TL-2023]
MDIAHQRSGFDLTPEELADWMLKLQDIGNVHNINFITPEHVVPQVALAILHAKDLGLKLPIIYNTSSFDSIESLELMGGLVDIYLPDFKVWKTETSKRLLKAEDYTSVAMESIKIMHDQVGDLCFTGDGIAKKGVLVRHLVMPGKEDEGAEIVRWLAANISKDLFVNVMEQYHPDAHVGRERRALKRSDQSKPVSSPEVKYADINRAVNEDEIGIVQKAAREAGLWRFAEAAKNGGFNVSVEELALWNTPRDPVIIIIGSKINPAFCESVSPRMIPFAATQWGQLAPPAPLISQISPFHQEKIYLLTILAAEESHATRLLKALAKRRAELQDTTGHNDKGQVAASLKKAIGGIKRKLKRCYKTQAAVASSLKNVNIRLQEIEQLRWKGADQAWTQQTQDQWLNEAQAGLQRVSLGQTMTCPVSESTSASRLVHPLLISPSTGPPQAFTAYPSTSDFGFQSFEQATASPQNCPTPTLSWTWTASPMSPMYTPFYASSSDGSYCNQPPMPSLSPLSRQTVREEDPILPPTQNDKPLSAAAKQLRRFQLNRTVSAPDIITTQGTLTSCIVKEAEDAIDTKTEEELSSDIEITASLVGDADAIRRSEQASNDDS